MTLAGMLGGGPALLPGGEAPLRGTGVGSAAPHSGAERRAASANASATFNASENVPA